MLACMLGNNREIFFPKLSDAQMMSFDTIAVRLLQQHGFRVLECGSDEEAVEKALELKNGSDMYPVHFSCSDTSGEKPSEEFFTDDEMVDMDRFEALGVIAVKEIAEKERIERLFAELGDEFDKEETTKQRIVGIMKSYLPNFEHIETGKSLDSKM